jgi:hypothetical protein
VFDGRQRNRLESRQSNQRAISEEKIKNKSKWYVELNRRIVCWEGEDEQSPDEGPR